MTRLLAVTVALLLLVVGHSHGAPTPSQCDAVVGNLVVNCGFENGFTSWNRDSEDNPVADTISPHTGLFAASFTSESAPGLQTLGPSSNGAEPLGTIGQTITTVPNQTYALAFFLQSSMPPPSLVPPGDGNKFVASVNGTPAFSIANVGLFPYTLTQVLFVATGPSTELTFSGFNRSGFITLDDITVTAAPEPAVLIMLGLGLAGLTLRRMKRGQRSD